MILLKRLSSSLNQTRSAGLVLKAALITCGMLGSVSIAAEATGQQQPAPQHPVHIQANQLDAYDQLGESHYQGNVVAKRAHLRLQSETLVVFHPQRLIDRIVANGQPAHFEMDDPEQGHIQGHADQIVYYVEQEIAHLIGNAFVKRQQTQAITAHLIIVDLTSMTMQATGSDQTSEQRDPNNGRIEMIFTPDNQD